MLFKNVICALASIFCCASIALAQDPYPIYTDDSDRMLNVMDGDTLFVNFNAQASYCCSAIPNGSAVNVGLSTAVSGPNMSMLTASARGDASPAVTVDPTADTEGGNNNRMCLNVGTTGVHTFSFNPIIGSQSILARCEETSITGGFNTNGTPINFLECFNNTGETVDIKVFAANSAGSVLISGDTFSISSRRRRDLDIHSRVGEDVFGSLVVTHDGPPGALSCRLSRYGSGLILLGSTALTRN